MAHQHSYRITLSNNRTEQAGLKFVMSRDPRMIRPSSSERKQLLEALGAPANLSQAFDLVQLPRKAISGTTTTISDFSVLVLVELKTTEAKLTNSPYGFFFGATENEFELAQRLGEQYRFCFVGLHEGLERHDLLTLAEVWAMTRNRRIQYQLNFRARPDD